MFSGDLKRHLNRYIFRGLSASWPGNRSGVAARPPGPRHSCTAGAGLSGPTHKDALLEAAGAVARPQTPPPAPEEGATTASCRSRCAQPVTAGCVSSTKPLCGALSRVIGCQSPQAPFQGATRYLFTSDGRFSLSPTEQTFRSALSTLHFNAPRDTVRISTVDYLQNGDMSGWPHKGVP